jgi:hypothetical protein
MTETFLGKPCKRGHLDEKTGLTWRYCSNGICVKCTPIHVKAKRARQQEYKKERRKVLTAN